MGADLYIKLKNPKIWGFERSDRAVEDGYYRDAYNDGSVLWKFGLSWWQDIAKLQNKNGVISVANTKKFLKMLDKNQDTFDKNGGSKTEADLLRKFLNIAIKEKSPIEASL